MSFAEKWQEHDYNPFFLFNNEGKILSLNTEAQFLLGHASTNILFELATSYANSTYGFKRTLVDVEFGHFKFFALTVGYDSEKEIGLKLYRVPSIKFSKPKKSGELVNVYALIDLCISSNSISSSSKFIKELDPTLPDVRLDTEQFIKFLNKIYQKNSSTMTTKLFLRIGEYVKFEDKKYSIFSILVTSNDLKEKSSNSEIELLAQEIGLSIELTKESIRIDLPLISN